MAVTNVIGDIVPIIFIVQRTPVEQKTGYYSIDFMQNLKDEKIGWKEGTRSGAEMESKAKRKHRKVIWKVERKHQECWLVQKAYRFLIAVIDP